MGAPGLDKPLLAEEAKREMENLPRQKLCEILDMYGRPICDEPQRCEALLRDLCVGHRREIFLLVAALKERVVPDILTSLGILPDDVIVSNLVRKLRDNLGLAEDPSRWAAETWMFAIRNAPAVGRIKKPPPRPAMDADSASAGDSEAGIARQARVDWAWIGLCLAALLSSGVALAVVTRVSFYHNWVSFLGWLRETGVLACGLALAWSGEFFAAHRFLRREAPHHSALDPGQNPAALLVEVLVLLVQPLVPLGVLALWLGEWMASLHVAGQGHDLAFHLGRLIQSIPVGFFVFKWVGLMTIVQGRISTSMVRRR
jgi:hypothetical protein